MSVKLTMPNGMVLEIPQSGCLAMAGQSGCQSWPKPLTNFVTEQPAKADVTLAGVPLTPIMPPWELPMRTAELLIAWIRWKEELAKKPVPNASQQGALNAGNAMQGFLLHSDINLP